MKQFFLCWFLLPAILITTSCCSSNENNISKDKLINDIPVAWKNDVHRPLSFTINSDETGIYFYNCISYDLQTIKLNRIDPQTGKTIWRTEDFGAIELNQPEITDKYIFVFLKDNSIHVFNKDNGELAARVKVNSITSGVFLYENYFYFGFFNNSNRERYLARLNIDSIIKDNNTEVQIIEPELLWNLETNMSIYSKPFVYNDIAYFNLGVDSKIIGCARAFNQLHGSKMITVADSKEFPYGQVIALDLSGLGETERRRLR